MTAKDSDKNQWTDPKDYGLPFVEITPIRAKSSPVEEVVTLPNLVTEVEPKVESSIPAKTVEKTDSILAETPVSVKEKAVAPKPASPIEPAKKPTSWVWLVLVLGLAIVAFIIWQIQSQSSSTTIVEQSENIEGTTSEETTVAETIEPETTIADSAQSAVNQDSIQVINNSNSNISKPAETGTTIANVASGNLIRIASKAERPQYFIIVGSLPNEKLAIEEASQYFSKSPEIYLISPEEGSRNYRLGLFKSGSFRIAAEELERIKSQYSEELWILKY